MRYKDIKLDVVSPVTGMEVLAVTDHPSGEWLCIRERRKFKRARSSPVIAYVYHQPHDGKWKMIGNLKYVCHETATQAELITLTATYLIEELQLDPTAKPKGNKKPK